MLMQSGGRDNPVETYRLDADAVMSTLKTNKTGLTTAEANTRFTQDGGNVLVRINKTPAWVKFFAQFKDLMIMLLLISAAISLYLKDSRTAVILFVIVMLNAGIGFYQEHKAENIMASLEKLVVPHAKVYRDGKLNEIDSANIVVGDILYIQEGDSIPADGRILQETELSTNDFALTGESNPSRKFVHSIKESVELPVRHNLVFMGTTVATGDALIIVTGTGMRTELGRIANLSQDTKQDLSPLQKEMNHLARTITYGTVILGSLLAFISLKTGQNLHETFVFAIGIASAMIPQGLPAEVNTALAGAAAKLAKERALVKKLSAVETLGATSIICTDKTGTLTKNEMTVEQLYVGGKSYWVSGTGYEANGVILNSKKQKITEAEAKDLSIFFACGLFASNASINPPDNDHVDWFCLGDPTEGALITLVRKSGVDDHALNIECPELREFPFDSGRKRMSSIRKYNGKLIIFVKGAPENVLEKCTNIWADGKSKKLSLHDHESFTARNEMLASGAMRNLAFAYKELPASTDISKLTMEDCESGLALIGMASMIDPPRDEIPEAMMAARRANIPVSIITGDNALTAKAIALKAHLAEDASELKIVLGEELRNMSDNDVLKLITRGQVIFSRVAPEDKLRIVELGKSAGKIVAVTGDGINDAPALKRADIGVAMGRTGTDVAKQSAEIILLDDSFHTLVGAIQQGRIIFQNIKKATLACLTSNTGELFTVLISLIGQSIFGIPIAISAVLILGVDLMAELFPISALAWDPAEEEVMTAMPRDPKHHILSRSNIIDLMWSGLLIGVLTYSNFLFYFVRNHQDLRHINMTSNHYLTAITLSYVTICLCQFFNILLRRIGHGKWVFTPYLWANKKLLVAFGISMSGILIIAYVPVVQRYMGTAGLGIIDWLWALVAASIYLAIRQFTKLHHKSS